MSSWHDKRAELRAEGAALIERARSENRSMSAHESDRFDVIRGMLDQGDREDRAAGIRRDAGQGGQPFNGRVGGEAEVYNKRSGHSWFRDLAEVRKGNGAAGERLAKQSAQTLEVRFDMNTTAGTGGEFAPPLWLVDQWVKLARAGRVTADLIGAKPLPSGVSSINLPKVATGTAAAVQSSQGVSLQDTAMTTTSVTSGIVTIGAQQTVSLQLLEQSGTGFDEVILGDMAAAYAVSLDTQVLTAAASAPWNGGGLANVAGQGVVSYTQASPTVTGAGQFYSRIASAINTVATTRFLPATALLLHPRRWAWVLDAIDSQNRPLVVPSAQGPYNAAAEFVQVDGNQKPNPVGYIQGLPVYTDANIPTNLSTGGGSNEDVAYVLREDDLFLYESDLSASSFDATYANSLEMLFRVHAYSAAIFNRYPASICSISGTGMNAPSF